MTSTKRLKNASPRSALQKRRRHSSKPCTPVGKIRCRDQGRQPSKHPCSPAEPETPRTPPAPPRRAVRRRAAPDWLRLVVTVTDSSSMNEALAKFTDEDAGLEDLVFVEWPEWDPSAWELLSSECIWTHILLVASRYGTLVVVEEILRRLSRDQIVQTTNEYQQNALVALCSQPPSEILMFEPRQYRPALLRYLQDHSDAAVSLGGVRATSELNHILQAAHQRQEEMSLIAAALLAAGVSPIQPDRNGLTALDYAHRFNQRGVLGELDRKVASSALIAQPQLAKSTDSAADFRARVPIARNIEPPRTPEPADSSEEQLTSPQIVQRKVASPGRGVIHVVSTGDTLLPADIQTPTWPVETMAELKPDEEAMIQSCASSLPTACELVSAQKRRGKRLTGVADYVGYTDLAALTSLGDDALH